MVALIATRAVRNWRYERKWWLIGALTVSVLLLIVIVVEQFAHRRRRRFRDDVPKNPLGLE